MCGAIAYEVEDAFRYALNCHCSRCRRATGAAYKPLAGIELKMLRIVKGEGDLLRYGDAMTHDAHCRHCGSLVWSVVRDGAYAHVTMGTLHDAPSIRPTQHIFVGSKAPWHDITDDLPQKETF